MSDCEDTDESCGEEQVVSEWEVRQEWLESILSKYYKGEVKVLNFEVSSKCTISETALSSIIPVKCRYVLLQGDFRYHNDIIIKLLPKDPFSRFFVTECQFDLREIKFYTEIVPELKKLEEKIPVSVDVNLTSHGFVMHEDDVFTLSVPRCYYTHYTPAGGTEDSPIPPESILVLENLHESGYHNVKFSEGLTKGQVKMALQSIADIHARALAMKVTGGQPLNERYPFLFQTTKATDSYQQLVERGLPQLARFLKRRPGLKEVLDALLILRPRTKDIISSLLAPEGPIATITHTDFWCNNLLFEPTIKKCMIIDWQMVSYSRPTNDVALLLVSSVPTKLRRNYTNVFLDTYWQFLTETSSHLGVDIPKTLGYTREDLEKDYRRSLLLALFLCIGSVDVALGDPLTEQRLIDVLKDLYNDGILTDEISITSSEAES